MNNFASNCAKSFSRLTLLGILLTASSPLAYADTVALGSFATGTTAASLGFSASQTAVNLAGFTPFASPPALGSTPALQNGVGSTYTLMPGSTWGAPSGSSTWVGMANGGPGGMDPAYGYYQYETKFSAAGGTYSGSMALMADDTAEVLLNGTVMLPFGPLGSDVHCADTGVSCMQADILTFSGMPLQSGYDANTLTFIVEQAGLFGFNDPSGIDFTATVARDLTPEPASVLLCATGLITAAALFLRRRNAF